MSTRQFIWLTWSWTLSLEVRQTGGTNDWNLVLLDFEIKSGDSEVLIKIFVMLFNLIIEFQ